MAAKSVSEIENGHTNPSVAVLARLVEQGIGVPLAAFFSGDSPSELRDDLAKIQARVAGQSSTMRRRALRLLKTFFEE